MDTVLSMSVNEIESIPYAGEKNTGTNWLRYKRCIETYAYMIDGLEILRGEAQEPKLPENATEEERANYEKEHSNWDIKNRNLFYVLCTTQSPQTRMLVDRHELGDTAGIWASLLARYEKYTRATIQNLMNRLITTKRTTTTAQFIHEVTQCAEQLRYALKKSNVDVWDVLLTEVLLIGAFPNNPSIAAYLLLDDQLTYEKCQRKLLDFVAK